MSVTELMPLFSPPALSEDKVKSDSVTPVTSSLKVTLYINVWLLVFSTAGSYLLIDVTVGAVSEIVVSVSDIVIPYTRWLPVPKSPVEVMLTEYQVLLE